LNGVETFAVFTRISCLFASETGVDWGYFHTARQAFLPMPPSSPGRMNAGLTAGR